MAPQGLGHTDLNKLFISMIFRPLIGRVMRPKESQKFIRNTPSIGTPRETQVVPELRNQLQE